MDAIAQYGSSEEDDDPGHRLPSVSDLFTSQADVGARSNKQDNQSRVRSFPHVEGNYAVHVFIDIPVPPTCVAKVDAFLRAIMIHCSDLQPVEPIPEPKSTGTSTPPLALTRFHLSLSRSAPVRLPQIDSLRASLRHSLRRIKPFEVIIGEAVDIFVNDDGTRTFISATAKAISLGASTSQKIGVQQVLAETTDPILRAIDSVSNVFQKHGLPRFYEDARLHVSMGWTLGQREMELRRILEHPVVKMSVVELNRDTQWRVRPSTIWLRVGQRWFPVWECPALGPPKALK